MSSQAELKRWSEWTDPDFFAEGRQSERRFLPLFLRQIIPVRRHRTRLTLTGWMLIVVAVGIGSAAYNTGSNILFLTLSLMLSSLVLSGILSLINFKKLKWSIQVPKHLQAGEVGVTEILLENRKSIFPSMSICFRLKSSEVERETLLYMPRALRAGETTRLDWTYTPARRGRCRISLNGVGSKFPFGFLDKAYGDYQDHEVLVWPARAAYQFFPAASGHRFLTGVSRRSSGPGSDLLNIRDYSPGDPPRLIHWKATARLNKLMIRQLAQEGQGGFVLEIDPDKNLWSEELFEQLCSLACSLADDLFHLGRLDSARVLGVDVIAVRCLRDLHSFYDQLAILEPAKSVPARSDFQSKRNCITFRPLRKSGIALFVDETQIGQSDG